MHTCDQPTDWNSFGARGLDLILIIWAGLNFDVISFLCWFSILSLAIILAAVGLDLFKMSNLLVGLSC